MVNALNSIFVSFGLSFQEAGIALIGKDFENLRRLRNFALGLALFASGALSLIGFTSISSIWYQNVSGLSQELATFAIFPTRIISIIPFLTVVQSLQRSILVNARATNPITRATAIEVGVIALVLLLGIHLLNMVGILAAVSALVLGRLCDDIYLLWPLVKALRKENGIV